MSKADRDNWIRETQLFEQVAKRPITSYEELGLEYDEWQKEKADRKALRKLQKDIVNNVGRLGPLSRAIGNFKR